MTSISAPEAPFDAPPTQRRARRDRGPRASGTSATRATSCGWCLGRRHRCARRRHRAGHATTDGVDRRPRARGGARPDIGPRAGARAHAGRERSSCPVVVVVGLVVPAAVAPARARRARRPRRRRVCSRCSTPLLDLPGRRRRRRHRAAPGSRRRGSRRSAYLAGAAAAAAVGKPWLVALVAAGAPTSALAVLGVVMAIAGSAGVPELLLARRARRRRRRRAARRLRRAQPPAVARRGRRPRSRDGGLAVTGLTLERAEGGRSQLYVADTRRRRPRVRQGVRARQPRRRPPVPRLPHAHAAAVRTTTGRRRRSSTTSSTRRSCCCSRGEAGVTCPRSRRSPRCPTARWRSRSSTSTGAASTSWRPDEIDADLLDAVWHEVGRDARARGSRTGRLRAANVLVADGRPVLIDLGFGEESATPRLQAIDRAELLASLAALVGAEPVGRVGRACHRAATTLAAAAPYLQPLALSAATRKQASKSLLQRAARRRSPRSRGEEPRAARAAGARAGRAPW